MLVIQTTPATLNIYKIDACVIIGTISACATRASRRITSTAYSCISPSDLSEEDMQPCVEGGKWTLLAQLGYRLCTSYAVTVMHFKTWSWPKRAVASMPLTPIKSWAKISAHLLDSSDSAWDSGASRGLAPPRMISPWRRWGHIIRLLGARLPGKAAVLLSA